LKGKIKKLPFYSVSR